MAVQPFDLSVEAGKVREFAASVRSSDPEHLGADPVSPPTFLMAAAWWQDEKSDPRSEITLDRRRLLHGEQEFTFFGEPPAAGTQLIGQGRIDRVYTKPGKRGGEMTFAEIVTTYTDALDGHPVAEVRMTLIETARPPKEDA